MKEKCTYLLNVPSGDTPRIQEVHILLGHIICELVEQKLLKNNLLMRTSEAIVLAGGFGTRLKDLLPGIPKCMASVNGKPFLTYVLAYLEHQKINKVILSVGYLKDHIIKYFGNSYSSITIEYAVENEPLGTGGAIKFALQQCHQDQVFVINGDTFFNAGLESMQELHNRSTADITIAVKQVDDSSRYGLVETDGSGRITAFREKEILKGRFWINGGIYLINKQAIENISVNKFSLENDIFKVSCSSLKLQSFESEEPFLDMGIPEDYTGHSQCYPNLRRYEQQTEDKRWVVAVPRQGRRYQQTSA